MVCNLFLLYDTIIHVYWKFKSYYEYRDASKKIGKFQILCELGNEHMQIHDRNVGQM